MMKSSLLGAVALLSSLTAAQEPKTVDLFYGFIYGRPAPGSDSILTDIIRFSLYGYGAPFGTTCEVRAAPTFPTDRYKCEDPRYSFVFREAGEGSTLDYGLDLYYEDPETGENAEGGADLDVLCFPYGPKDEDLFTCDLRDAFVTME